MCLVYLKIEIEECKQKQSFENALLNIFYDNLGKIHKEKPSMILHFGKVVVLGLHLHKKTPW